MAVKLILVVLCLSALHCSNAHETTAIGRILCKIPFSRTPLIGALVKLKDKDATAHDTFGSTRTSETGSFSITGSAKDAFNGEPEPYLELVYNYRGTNGRMVIDTALGITRKYKTSTREYSRYINFGDIVLDDEHCRAYVNFHDALKDYKERTGQIIPFSPLKVRTATIVHGGTPYALGTAIKIPKDYYLVFHEAQHELAHTVRHKLDGSHSHFLNDAIRFWYARDHTCNTRTNNGFAFQEGFAEFWAGTCIHWSGHYGSSPTDYTIEGNVATALANLKRSCGLSDARIIDILARNPKKIHSFAEFKTKSGCP